MADKRDIISKLRNFAGEDWENDYDYDEMYRELSMDYGDEFIESLFDLKDPGEEQAACDFLTELLQRHDISGGKAGCFEFDEEQKARIEAGYAMLYTGENGATRYIESVLDINGNPAKTYEGKVYVWLSSGSIDWCAHPDGKPVTLERARDYIDGIAR